MPKAPTQETQVIEALRKQGGYATLRRLYEVMDFSSWKTRTPEASVRKIVQESNSIFKIQPGLWALEELRDEVLKRFKISNGNKRSEERFSHSYYQGLLIEIGRYRELRTYIPAQDKHRKFLEKDLEDMADTIKLPKFTYERLLRKARTVDVIWFNKREMPKDFIEVEHTTDIKNSLSKFYELQDFNAEFHIVAADHREADFREKIGASMFDEIRKRVQFISYSTVASIHSSLSSLAKIKW